MSFKMSKMCNLSVKMPSAQIANHRGVSFPTLRILSTLFICIALLTQSITFLVHKKHPHPRLEFLVENVVGKN